MLDFMVRAWGHYKVRQCGTDFGGVVEGGGAFVTGSVEILPRQQLAGNFIPKFQTTNHLATKRLLSQLMVSDHFIFN